MIITDISKISRNPIRSHLYVRRVRLKLDGTRWRTGGEVKGKLANGVGSQYSSHYLGTWCIQHYYRWSAHLGCQQSTELTPPSRFKWTRPFRRKTKSDFCACTITFQTHSSTIPWVSRRPLSAHAQTRSHAITCHICGGQSGTGTRVSPSTTVCPSQYHSVDAQCSLLIPSRTQYNLTNWTS